MGLDAEDRDEDPMRTEDLCRAVADHKGRRERKTSARDSS